MGAPMMNIRRRSTRIPHYSDRLIALTSRVLAARRLEQCSRLHYGTRAFRLGPTTDIGRINAGEVLGNHGTMVLLPRSPGAHLAFILMVQG